MEAAMKLARQYYLEIDPPEPSRTRFIAREHSYHGTTLGSLSMSGHVVRRAKYEPMLVDYISRVSRCFAFRDKHVDETDSQYVARLAHELDLEFQRVGIDTVCAFVAEPIVGAVSEQLKPAKRSRTNGFVGSRVCSFCSRLLNGNESNLRQIWCIIHTR
jgi:adenosylmethionine-8-amino-7-oxononanoate aminotransferase